MEIKRIKRSISQKIIICGLLILLSICANEILNCSISSAEELQTFNNKEIRMKDNETRVFKLDANIDEEICTIMCMEIKGEIVKLNNSFYCEGNQDPDNICILDMDDSKKKCRCKNKGCSRLC